MRSPQLLTSRDASLVTMMLSCSATQAAAQGYPEAFLITAYQLPSTPTSTIHTALSRDILPGPHHTLKQLSAQQQRLVNPASCCSMPSFQGARALWAHAWTDTCCAQLGATSAGGSASVERHNPVHSHLAQSL